MSRSSRRNQIRRMEENLRSKWRLRVLNRDVICRACGFDNPPDPKAVHVAHVTPMSEFRAVFGRAEGTKRSYREDNLVLLCIACHAAQESAASGHVQVLDGTVSEWLRERHPGDSAEKVLDYPRRLGMVRKLFDEIRAQRGWSSAQDLPDKITSRGGT